MRTFYFPFLSAIFAMLAVGCEKPVTAPPVESPPAVPEQSAAGTEEEEEDTSPETASESGSDAFNPTPKPEARKAPTNPELKPDNSVASILDVQRKADKILITGHFKSEYQTKDMIAILTEKFPDHEIVSELDVGPHVKTVGGWGNRVSELLVPLLTECEDGHFRFEGGVTTIEGTVANEGKKMSLHRHTGYVMEDLDSVGIENKLTVAK